MVLVVAYSIKKVANGRPAGLGPICPSSHKQLTTNLLSNVKRSDVQSDLNKLVHNYTAKCGVQNHRKYTVQNLNILFVVYVRMLSVGQTI
jgi:hypothetical protein